MSFVPYPPPPPMRGTVDNPGRQPTLVQALALLAGFVLLVAVLAAFSLGDSAAGLAATAGVAGFFLGAGTYLLATRKPVSPRR